MRRVYEGSLDHSIKFEFRRSDLQSHWIHIAKMYGHCEYRDSVSFSGMEHADRQIAECIFDKLNVDRIGETGYR